MCSYLKVFYVYVWVYECIYLCICVFVLVHSVVRLGMSI